MGASLIQRQARRPVKCGHGRDAHAKGNETLNAEAERQETQDKNAHRAQPNVHC